MSRILRFLGRFRNIKLKGQLYSAFALLSLMIVLTGGSGLFFANRIGDSVGVLTDVASPLLDEIYSLGESTQRMNVELLKALNRQDSSRSEQMEAALSDLEETSRAGLDRLTSLSEAGGFDLDIGAAAGLQQAFVDKARKMLASHERQLASAAAAKRRLEAFEQQRTELDALLAQFAKDSEMTMALREDRGKTLVQSGKATVDLMDEILDETFNQSYPLVQGSYKLMRFLMQLQDVSRAYMASSHTDELAVLERKFQSLVKKSKSRLKKINRRASTPEEKAQVKKVGDGFAKLEALILAEDGLFATYQQSLDAHDAAVALRNSLGRTTRDYQTSLEGVAELAAGLNEQAKQSTSSGIANALLSLSVIIGLGLLFASICGYALTRAITRPVVSLTDAMQRLADGEVSEETAAASLDRRDEIGALARSFMKLREMAIGAARSQSALDGATANFMIADDDCNIVYVNGSGLQMFRAAEADIRKDLPNFRADKLIGSNIDVFHKVPSHQRDMLKGLSKPQEVRIEVGGRTFDLVVTPVLDAQGERLGAAVEWADITTMERDVNGMLNAALQGDFSRRVSEDDMDGFVLDLIRGMNKLVALVDGAVGETVDVMAAMAQGDFSKRIAGDYQGSFLQLKDDSNAMSAEVAGIAGRIVQATGAVGGATEEIATGAQDLSSRTEQQAAALEETAASMEELSNTVKQNADNAQQANQLAAAAREAAAGGGEVVGSAVTAMGAIEDSSKKITEIVGLIDEIAFQTNLLALNAAVEAARAGEAGKGFAVVATEVRALAQRSSRASKDVKDLITTSDNQVREGVDLVKKTGESLAQIVTSIKKVADIVSDIAAASQEQAAGIDDVSDAITNMDEMTQQNAALVEETTAALQSMQSQVGALKQVVGFFKTGDEPANVSAPAVAPAKRPAANPVHKQQRKVAKKVAAAGGGCSRRPGRRMAGVLIGA